MNDMIRRICRENTDLTEKEINNIEEISSNMDIFCNLTGTDLFIDCFLAGKNQGIVVTHSRPEKGSQYNKNIQGDEVLPENEPIVFYTKKTGKPMRDARALSQEGRWVMQRTMPISANGRIIGVLIQESDVTEGIQVKRKLSQIRESSVNRFLGDVIGGDRSDEVVDYYAMVQEMHHRIKNNLQIISSILSMQARRSSSDETKNILEDNINRINSIALIHETMMNTPEEKDIDIFEQISVLAGHMMSYANGDGKTISIDVGGDHISTNSSRLLSILMVINELLTNSVQHGFPEVENGHIDICLVRGESYSTIVIRDNGIGIYSKRDDVNTGGGLGNDLVRMMVEEDLNGTLHTESEGDGTCIWFDFSML